MINPINNSKPTSAPIKAEAARGPGVGGTKTWAEYKPVAKHTVRIIIFFPDTLDISLIIEDINMNAASQNTGIDIMKPRILNVKGVFDNPNIEMNVVTILLVAPVSWRNFPKIVPIIIIGPIDNIIFLKPWNVRFKDWEKSIFKNKPVIKHVASKTIYGFILYFIEEYSKAKNIITKIIFIEL